MGSVADQLVCFLKYSWVAWVGLLLPYLACPYRDRVAQNQNFCFTVFSTHFRLSNFRLVFAVCLSVSCTNQEVYILDSAVTHKSMCTISLSNCFTLNFVYSLQFESPSSVCFCYPPSASLCCTFYGTVFAMSLLLTLASLFAFGGVRCLQGLDSYTHIRLETHTQVASR